MRMLSINNRNSVKNFIIEEVQKVVKEYGRNKPPFLAEKMAPIRNIKTIEKVNMEGDGLLIPVDGGFILQLNRNHPHSRQNFSCAHEIAHTFFYDLNKSPPIKVSGINSAEEEYLCNIAAAEMLMPENYLRGKAGENPSIDSLLNLAKKFRVSIQAMARRITEETGIWKCVISNWERNSREEFRRKWMYGPRQLLKRAHFPFLIINEKFGISETYKSDKIIKTKDKLRVGRTKITVITESYKISESSVITLISFPTLPIKDL